MTKATLYYATNRGHIGNNRWAPEGYGPKPSNDGFENLRFGRANLEVDGSKVAKFLDKDCGFGKGDGDGLTAYFKGRIEGLKIEAFEETLDEKRPDEKQAARRFGSTRTFNELREQMAKSHDVLIFIHGFNVSWEDAVASAFALQETLNAGANGKGVLVVLFSWPSDGLALPYVSYKSDRSDAELSGYAFGRGMLKLRDFLAGLRTRNNRGVVDCEQELHMLCHSMGNYVLQNTLRRIAEFNDGDVLPRIFDHIFLCAPDIDDDVFDVGGPLSTLPQLTRGVSLYHNKGDVAMYVSDYTKGNPERLGLAGAARPSLLHNKIQQIDCSTIVTGFVEHSYYLSGRVNQDIRQSIQGISQDDGSRKRSLRGNAWPNVWVMN
ncbi:MAG: alpha/beta hydrolase [Pseudomonadota bacterium]|nr:alpha/beta hydrolase [Pseudomonadota bacterium]